MSLAAARALREAHSAEEFAFTTKSSTGDPLSDVREIRLTGRVLEWGEVDVENATIRKDEVREYESKGYAVETIGNHIIAVKATAPDDGDIQIQPKSDMYGRMAIAGG